jgi:benzoyl-CoA reductase/2-hydroxyglutaryl-CoA dehydratase subunit BcrC/BadD/HgdB
MRNDPLPVSQADMILFIMVTQMCIRDYAGASEAAQLFYNDMKERVEQHTGILPKGTPRVLWGNHFPLNDPGIIKMVEQVGIAVPLSEIWYITTQPPVHICTDPVETIARRFTTLGLLASLTGRIKEIIGLVKDWQLDGVLWFNHIPCKVIGTDSLMLKKALKRELDVPITVIEGDMYDARMYNRQQIRTRVESFAEMLATRSKKTA